MSNAAHLALRVEVQGVPVGAKLLAPAGLSGPHGWVSGVHVAGGRMREIIEQRTGQSVLVIDPHEAADHVTITYRYSARPSVYPEAMFMRREDRYCRASRELVDAVAEIAPFAPPMDRARAIACALAEVFRLGEDEGGSPEGLGFVSWPGSDDAVATRLEINEIFIAALRSAGIEACLVTGYFLAAGYDEESGEMRDWVGTRIEGETAEWDIAQHLEMGVRRISPGLNPRPGVRMALGHSMGLALPNLGLDELKLLASPVWVRAGAASRAEITTHLGPPGRESPLLL